MNPVEHRVASGVEASALTRRVELAPGGKRGEQLVAVRIQALRVLVSFRRPWTLTLRRAANDTGNTAGNRCPPRVLENRGQPQNLPGSYRRFCIVSPQVTVLWNGNYRSTLNRYYVQACDNDDLFRVQLTTTGWTYH